MMGAGKSAIGRRVAKRLNLDFMDADNEIESAAGCSIPDIFERHGEEAFRDGERRVILRLLEGQVKGIATTVPLHLDLLSHSAFHEATIDTKFVERLLAE